MKCKCRICGKGDRDLRFMVCYDCAVRAEGKYLNSAKKKKNKSTGL